MNRELRDAAIRERALDRRASYIVQAPAGSGKTGLLIQRFLTLLGAADEPEEVLAITFTRRAAAEMRQRIRTALEGAAAGAAEDDTYAARTREFAQAALERSRARGWGLIDNPRRIRVRTIDSLCEELIRDHSPPDGPGGWRRTVHDAEEHYRVAVERLICREGEGLERVLRHLDNDLPKLEQHLVAMLARRDQWLPPLRRLGPGERRARLEAALGAAVTAELGRAAERFPATLAREILPLARYAGANLARSEPDSCVAALVELVALPPAVPEGLRAWRGLAELLVTGNETWRKQVNIGCGFPPGAGAERAEAQARKAEITQLIAQVAGDPENDGLREALALVRSLPDPCYTEEQWLLIADLLRLMHEGVAELELVFREREEADHPAAALGALRVLEEGRAGHGVRHLLVDEFQDTSSIQIALIEALFTGSDGSDGRTLFLVGDPMQSIYGFREAEVGHFLAAFRGRLGSVRLTSLRLESNFRSDPVIVDAVNRIFAAGFPEADIDRGAVSYAPFAAAPKEKREGGAAYGCRGFATADQTVEAEQVLAQVREAQAAGTREIAILVRNRTHAPVVLRLLREAGLAVRAVEFEPLAARPVVRDLRALVLALLEPADRAAWLTILRATWCGLELCDLAAIAAEPVELISEALRTEAVLSALTPDGRTRAERVAAALEDARRERERGSLRRSVAALWGELRGPAAADAIARADAETFLDLLSELEERGEPPSIERLDRRLERLYGRAAQDSGAVQVMTIHGAKGLEFDCVIVAGMGRFAKADAARLVFWQERLRPSGEVDLLLGPIRSSHGKAKDPIYELLARYDRERTRNERGRLLYVACTRARRRLHLFGHVGLRAGRPEPDSRSPLAAIWRGLANELVPTLAPPPAGEVPAVPRPVQPPIRRLASGWSAPPLLPAAGNVVRASEAATVSAGGDSDRAERRPGSDGTAPATRAIGSALHRLLDRIAREGIERWDDVRLARTRRAIAARLAESGVAEDALDAAAADVLAMASSALADPTGRWILSAHERGESEMAVTALLDGELVEGRIDRTFVSDGVRWIVDYKSARHEGGALESFLDAECERYRGQLDAYKRLLAGFEEGLPVRAGLYFPRYARFREV